MLPDTPPDYDEVVGARKKGAEPAPEAPSDDSGFYSGSVPDPVSVSSCVSDSDSDSGPARSLSEIEPEPATAPPSRRREYMCFAVSCLLVVSSVGPMILTLTLLVGNRTTRYVCVGRVESTDARDGCWVSGCPARVLACGFTDCASWGAEVPGICCGDHVCQVDGRYTVGRCSGGGVNMRELCTVVCGPRTLYRIRYTAPTGASAPVAWQCDVARGCANETLGLEEVLRPRACYQDRNDVASNRVRFKNPERTKRYVAGLLLGLCAMAIGVYCAAYWWRAAKRE